MELASMLYLSRGGVEYHVDVLMRKLKVSNRPALVAKSYFMGVLCHGWPPRVHPDYLKLSGLRVCELGKLLVFGTWMIHPGHIN